MHCFIADRRKTLNLSMKELEYLVSNLSPGDTVIVSGGEPTIGVNFLQVIKYIKSLGLRVGVQTNGFKFSDMDFAETHTPYIDHVMYNMHSHIPEIYNKIAISNYSDNPFENARDGLRNLYNLGISISTQTVISKANMDTLPDTYDWIQKHVPGVMMYLTFPHTVGNVIKSQDMFPTYSESEYAIKQIVKKWHHKIITVYIPHCYLYPYQYSRPYINVNDFGYNDQIFLHYGYDKSVEDKWVVNSYLKNYSENIVETSIKSDKCKTCIFDNECIGMRTNYYDFFKVLDVKPVLELTEKPYLNEYDLVNKIVPLQGSTRELHNKLTTSDFDKNLDIMKTNKITGVVNINSFNKNDISNIYDLYEKKSKLIDKFIVTVNPNDTNNLSLRDLKKYLLLFINKSYDIRGHILIKLYDIPYCVFGEYQHFIKNNNPDMKKYKTRINQCKDCVFNHICDGVFEKDQLQYSNVKPLNKIKTSEIYLPEINNERLEELILLLKTKFSHENIDERVIAYMNRHTLEETEQKVIEMLEFNELPTFSLRVGYSCNNFCIHCFVDDKKVDGGDMKLDQLKTIIDDKVVNKNTVVVITGGEPTLRDDLIDILKYIEEKDCFNTIQTNGYKFHDMDYLKELRPHIDSILLPIHSFDKNIFDEITRVKGSYDKIIQGFKNLVELRIPTTTQTVINQLNYKTLINTFDMIQEIKPGIKMTLTFPHPVGAADTRDVVPKYSEIAEYIQPVIKKYGKLMHVHYIPKCLLYPYQDDMVVIDDTDDGSIEKLGTDYINGKWSNTDYGEFKPKSRIKSVICHKCKFDNECLGVWKEYDDLYPLDLVPIIE